MTDVKDLVVVSVHGQGFMPRCRRLQWKTKDQTRLRCLASPRRRGAILFSSLQHRTTQLHSNQDVKALSAVFVLAPETTFPCLPCQIKPPPYPQTSDHLLDPIKQTSLQITLHYPPTQALTAPHKAQHVGIPLVPLGLVHRPVVDEAEVQRAAIFHAAALRLGEALRHLEAFAACLDELAAWLRLRAWKGCGEGGEGDHQGGCKIHCQDLFC